MAINDSFANYNIVAEELEKLAEMGLECPSNVLLLSLASLRLRPTG